MLMETIITRKCETCRYWQRIESMGECRYSLPVLTQSLEISALWPATQAKDWCRMWKRPIIPEVSGVSGRPPVCSDNDFFGLIKGMITGEENARPVNAIHRIAAASIPMVRSTALRLVQNLEAAGRIKKNVAGYYVPANL